MALVTAPSLPLPIHSAPDELLVVTNEIHERTNESQTRHTGDDEDETFFMESSTRLPFPLLPSTLVATFLGWRTRTKKNVITLASAAVI